MTVITRSRSLRPLILADDVPTLPAVRPALNRPPTSGELEFAARDSVLHKLAVDLPVPGLPQLPAFADLLYRLALGIPEFLRAKRSLALQAAAPNFTHGEQAAWSWS